MSKGFTLPEMMIALGLGSIMFLLGTTGILFVNHKAQQADAAMQSQIQGFDVKNALGKHDICTANLQGVKLKIDEPEGSPIQTIDAFDVQGNKTQNIVKVGAQLGAMTVESIQLVPKGDLNGLALAAELQIFAKAGNLPLAPRRINILAKMNSDKIIQCVGIGDMSLTAESICEYNGMIYDRGQKQCVAPPGKWFTGTPYNVSCGAGYIPNPSWWNPCDCWSPGNYEEMFGMSRTYTNGMTQNGGPPPARNNYDDIAQSCSCNYANDVDPAQWQAAVYCKAINVNTIQAAQ